MSSLLLQLNQTKLVGGLDEQMTEEEAKKFLANDNNNLLLRIPYPKSRLYSVNTIPFCAAI
jgi:hypothetical protein